MIHLSVRLPWHDRGWDGHICDRPELNGYCCGLRSVNAERIRTRNVDEEVRQRGQSVSGMSYRPPCTETLNVFGMEPVTHLHIPPSFIDGAQPTQEVYDPGSSGTWPFENMWLPNGEFRPAVERKQEADQHFKAVEPKRSFVFYYCNYDSPLSGDANRYLLVGAARIKSIAPVSSTWPGATREASDRYGGFVWSRRLNNGGPDDRVRLPYQEMLKAGIPADELNRIAAFVPGDLSDRFKYVSRHLDDDDAVNLLEQMLGFYHRANSSGLLLSGSPSFQHALSWLDSALADCWLERGPFPGLAAVLHFLDFKEPAEFVKNELGDIPPERRRDWVFACIEEEEDPPPMQRHRFEPSIDRWKSLDPSLQKVLKERMVLFALNERQLEMALGPKRKSWGIEASWSALYDNPYILSEDFLGETAEDRISFSRIDHGMRPRPPHDTHARVEAVSRIDGRRLRALLVDCLRDATQAGHTFLDQTELAEVISDPDGDSSAVRGALVDDARWRQHRELFGEKLILSQVDGVNAVFLKTVHEDEARIRTDVVRLINDDLFNSSGLDWKSIVASSTYGAVAEDALPQQAAALEVLYRSRFSILTGGAGTGKTTVLRAFVMGLKKLEQNHPVLLLAPTGKASVLLESRVGLQSETIHRFLARLNWMRLNNFSLLRSGGEKETSGRTIIVDESSMLNVTLLAATLRAINFEYVDRLILVGDPGQLPPIGPGKPFLDLIEYLKKNELRESRHLGELAFNCRQAEGSRIALLADHFARVEERPPEDVFELLHRGGDFGDLSVRTYANEEELPGLVGEVYLEELRRLASENSLGSVGNPIANYRGAFRLDDLDRVDLDRLQVLAPYRLVIDQINEIVRRKVLGLAPTGMFNGLAPYDRVMQTQNKELFAFASEIGQRVKKFVPNGQIGFVSQISREAFERKGKRVPIRFAPDYGAYLFDMTSQMVEENLSFAYGLSIHKAQGSQFDTVIAVVPARETEFLSRELIYTLITRAQRRVVLLLEKDAGTLLSRTWGGHSELLRRNSAIFRTARGWRSGQHSRFRPEGLIHEAVPDLFVRSRGEATIARALSVLGIAYYYERGLPARDGGIGRSPDFTFRINRRDWYLEHLGMRGVPKYDKDWERKKQWYAQNGYAEQLLTTPVEGKSLFDSLREIFCGRFGYDERRLQEAVQQAKNVPGFV